MSLTFQIPSDSKPDNEKTTEDYYGLVSKVINNLNIPECDRDDAVQDFMIYLHNRIMPKLDFTKSSGKTYIGICARRFTLSRHLRADALKESVSLNREDSFEIPTDFVHEREVEEDVQDQIISALRSIEDAKARDAFYSIAFYAGIPVEESEFTLISRYSATAFATSKKGRAMEIATKIRDIVIRGRELRGVSALDVAPTHTHDGAVRFSLSH